MINKKVFLTLLGILISAPLFAQVGSKTDFWEWTEQRNQHDAVVKVVTDGGIGTGVLVHIDLTKEVSGGHYGHVMTAYHVVKNEDSIKIEYRNCKRSSKDCTIVGFDEKHDVALVWVWVPKKIVPAEIAKEAAKGREELEFVGLGGTTKLNGRLRTFRAYASKSSNENFLRSDAFLIPGDSGGPVFNKSGQLVGINSGGWFWLEEKYIKEENLKITWPARAGGVGPMRKLFQKIKMDLAKN